MQNRRLKNEINVVPYIDVMLVLLVIFMVTAPMMVTSSIDVPSVAKSSQAPAEALRVNIHADESLSLHLPGQPKPRGLTREELTQALIDAQRQNPKQPVLIVGDRKVKYEAVLQVMDELQRRRIERVALLVQPFDAKTAKK
jgi:biopolymer transport protein TolR